jgi:hypothetical protein
MCGVAPIVSRTLAAFIHGSIVGVLHRAAPGKVFWFFFSKKNIFLKD